ncbi:hypothetical protein [Microbacterium sp.]|uniref:hypothetical protein n=1 Tax=Microbacterium sp. TaxID=51671 RepID=UPI0039E37578
MASPANRPGASRTAYLIATSATDDAAFEALIDLSGVIAGHEETAIIGGHMVTVLSAAFPAPGLVERRTQDADAGISVELASTGELHDELIALGYTAVNGNRYVKGEAEPQSIIDLLIPTVNARFREQRAGARRFDAMPGLSLALNTRLLMTVALTFQDGTERIAEVLVPGIEGAIILKALAWGDRPGAQKDALDLSNLFAILEHHDVAALGEQWRLDEAVVSGHRLTAATMLHRLADSWDSRPPTVSVDTRALVSRIRRRVTDPR